MTASHRLASLGGVLLVLTLVGAAIHIPAGTGLAAYLAPGAEWDGTHGTKLIFIALLALCAAIYFLAVRLVLRSTLPRRAVWLVLLLAIAMRVPALLGPPLLSSDIYRYVWDGRVQAAGINPYRYIPADPALAGLRDTVIYPHINRADYAPTIYPPAAQIVFGAIGRIDQSVLAVKTAMVLFELLAMACLLGLLAIARLPPARLLIYAWNPLPLWAFAGDGHVDAIAVGLLALALLLRARLRDGLAGAVLGAAVLVKFLPAVVAPALWRRGGGWRAVAGAAVVIAALYAIYSGVGWKVFGFLSAYGDEEGLYTGSGIWLLAGLEQLAPLPSWASTLYFAAVAIGLAWLGARIAFGRHPAPGTPADALAIGTGTALLAACLTAAISPHYPWYFAWLALPAVLWPSRTVIWLSASPVLLYLNPFPDQFTWPSLVFIPAVLLAASELRRPRLAASALEGNT